MFDNKHRPDGWVFPSCADCQNATRKSDLVVAIVSRFKFGETTGVEDSDFTKFSAGLRNNAPEILAEWRQTSLREARNQRRNFQNLGLSLGQETSLIKYGDKTVAQLRLFAHKLALAAHFQTHGRIVSQEGGVWAVFHTKEMNLANGSPHEFLNLLGPVSTLSMGKSNAHDQFAFRIGSGKADRVTAIAARLRNGLLIYGCTIEDIRGHQTQPHVGQLRWLAPQNLSSEFLY